MRGSAVALAVCFTVAFSLARESNAAIVVVEPDAYADGVDISNAFAGVTLSASGTSPINTTVIAHATLASTPPNAFAYMGSSGIADAWYPFPGDGRPHAYLRADFVYPTDWVAIDVISNDSSPNDFGALQAFDAGGSLLATASSVGLLSGQFQTISIARPSADIAYVLASGYYAVPGNPMTADNVNLDRLQFNLVPEPATLSLVVLGGLGLWRRHRKC